MQPKEVAKQKCNPIWLHFYFLWIPVEKCHHNESLAHIYVETIRYEVQIEAILPKDQPVASNRGNTKLALKCLAQIFPHFGRKIGESYESVSQYSLRKNSQVAHPDKFDRYFHLTLEYVGYRKSDVIAVLRTMSSAQIREFVLKMDQENLSYDFLEEIKAEAQDVSADRAKVLVDALIKAGCQLDNKDQRSMFSLRSHDLAEYIVYDLLERAPVQNRQQYFEELVNTADPESIAFLSGIINMLELAYGRLAAGGQERSSFAKILSLEGLITLEAVFANKVKELVSCRSLLTFRRWRMILHLMESFDAEFTSEYMSTELLNDENVLRYIEGSVSRWIGSGVSYEVSNEYTKYLTKERVLQAIQNQKENRNMYELPQEVQYASVAFFLHETEGRKNHFELSQQAIKETLQQWQNLSTDA